jgi:CheY-like chemotaxis protein
MIRERTPDLVVSDVLMPKRDGFSLATALMEEDVQPRPVLFLTSAVYKHAKWKHEALTTYGAHEFLRKPVDADDLTTAVRKYFRLADPIEESESDRSA